MISRLLAGALALTFIAFIERGARPIRRRRVARPLAAMGVLIAAASLAPLTSRAAERIAEGAVVRMQSAYIEAGWHEGTLRRAPNKCWMVSLKKPTRDKYTLLALTTAKRLQTSRNGQWLDTSTTANLADQPRECLEDAAD